MGAAFFYHLTQSPVEDTLRMLAGKAQGAGWRVYVKCDTQQTVDMLDQALWQGERTAFLAHGTTADADAGQQPVLLGCGDPPPDYTCIMCVSGTEVTAQMIKDADRTCILFDGHNEDAVATARTQWKTITSAQVAAQYWAQDDGSWVKRAETDGS